jgi:acetyl-CoA acetyltransferase
VEQLAMVSIVQREWAAKSPRATVKTPITVDDVLNSRMIAYPFRLLQCCLVTPRHRRGVSTATLRS